MTDTIIGIIEAWSDITPTKFKSVRTAAQINGQWYGKFSKDITELQTMIAQNPVGSKVRLEYLTKGDFFNIVSIGRLSELEQKQLPIPAKGQIGPKRIPARADQISKSVALKAAVDFYQGRKFLSESDRKDVAAVITELAEYFLEWLTSEKGGKNHG